jgi:tetratricopeptide (TPR) repeat protein
MMPSNRWLLAALGLALGACGSSVEERPLSSGRDEPAPLAAAASFASSQPPVRHPVAAADPVPGLIAAMRDPRRSRLLPRSLALVVTELQQLEALRGATDPGAKDYPVILRRVAEDYAELEIAGAADPRKVEAARAGVLRTYTELLAAQGGSYPLADEVRYFLGWEYERAGDLTNARRLYFEVVSRSPGSKYVPLAYFAFGEAFWREADADPGKIDLAKQAYMKVLTFPPPGNGAYGWAWIRLGQVAEKSDDRAAALEAYHRAEDYARQYEPIPEATKVTVAIPAWVEGAGAAPR